MSKTNSNNRRSMRLHLDRMPADEVELLLTQYMESYQTEPHISEVHGSYLPCKFKVLDILEDLRELIFPGFHCREDLSGETLANYTRDLLERVSTELMFQMKLAYITSGLTEEESASNATKASNLLFSQIPEIRRVLAKDVEAAYEGDPAAQSYREIIMAYPGLYAICVYRLAHALHELEVPLLPRIMTEQAHVKTGIDIHPGAKIAESFFIDHGTGIVIGETAEIGCGVKIYQGVTLGALSTRGGQRLSGKKRHPTIEDDVTIYSGASILGGETVIGRGATIGGNVFLTESVDPDVTVTIPQPDLSIRKHGD